MENSSKRGQYGITLLLHSGKITADMAKNRGSSRTAKRVRNLLLNFGHPKTSFGRIVGKRNPQIIEQGQCLVDALLVRVDQVLALLCLLLPLRFSEEKLGGGG